MSWLSSAISFAGIALGAKVSSDANDEAAEIAEAEADRKSEAIRRGNELSQQRYEEIREDTAPAVDYLRRTVAADPYQLTPEQQSSLDDAHRQTIRGLAASGLRGAGRTTEAAVGKTEERFRGGAIEFNRRRSDDAATKLAGPYFNASGNAATQEAATGQNVANIDSGHQANAVTANSTNTAQTLGALSSFIADETKNEGRKSRYADHLPNDA